MKTDLAVKKYLFFESQITRQETVHACRQVYIWYTHS